MRKSVLRVVKAERAEKIKLVLMLLGKEAHNVF